jgi:hypothetical protein
MCSEELKGQEWQGTERHGEALYVTVEIVDEALQFVS